MCLGVKVDLFVYIGSVRGFPMVPLVILPLVANGTIGFKMALGEPVVPLALPLVPMVLPVVPLVEP